MTYDIRFAIRLFLRERGLFGVTLASLAFAIGVSTAVFTVLNASAFRGYGAADPASIYRLLLDNRLTGPVSRGGWMAGVWAYDDYVRLARNTSSVAVAASAPSAGSLRVDVTAPVLPSGHIAVSGTYFAVMDVRASLGRVLAPADDLPDAPPVLVLAYTFWTHTFGGDASIVGRTVWIDDTPFVVAGVAARLFTGPTDGGAPPGFWIPLTAARTLELARARARAAADLTALRDLKSRASLNTTDRERLRTLDATAVAPIERWNPPVTIHARPSPGVSRTQIDKEVTALATAFAAERGQQASTDRAVVSLESLQERQTKQASSGRNAAWMVASAIGLVILLASANLANLLLAGAIRRGREVATRLALGAGRWRIVRQLVTESVLLGLIGGAAGFVIAIWLTPLFGRIWLWHPEYFDLAPDFTTYLFVIGASLAVGATAGLAPARYGRHGDLASALKVDQAGGSSSVLPRGYLRSLLVGGQSAASILLLVVAALFARASIRAATFDLGFDVNHLLEVSVGLGGGYDQARIETYWQAALEKIRRLPGVAAAGVTDSQPFSANGTQRWQGGRLGLRETSSAEYFHAIGVRVLMGRTYTAEEVRGHEPVAVISASVARLYWGHENPLGADLSRVWGPADAASASRGWNRKPGGTVVVGVVADTITDLEAYDAPTIYMPSESLHANTQLMVRSTGDPADVIGPVRDALRSVDPEQRPGFFLVRDRFQKELAEPRRTAALSTIIGVTALGLAAVGLFGVTAFLAGQRRREIGVRTALGAGRRDIVGMLVRDSLRPVVVGLVCGMVAALWTGRFVQTSLYGLSGWDPVAIVVGVSVLLSAALAAAYLPARRAADVDPARVLRGQ